MPYRIGIFATGRGQGSRGLLQAIRDGIQSGHVPASVAFVFSNREPGEFEPTDGFFDQVRSYGYPLVTLSFRRFRAGLKKGAEWRTLYDQEVMAKLEAFSSDLCVLAGYLLIVGPDMARKFTMVNLHPAAPGGPTGMWQDVIWQLIEQRAEMAGNTIFYATEDLDRGPTVTYSTYAIRGGQFDRLWEGVAKRSVTEIKAAEGEDLQLFKRIRNYGMARERLLVVETVKALAEGRIRVACGQLLSSDGKPMNALDLTPQIEALVAANAPRPL